MFNEIFNEKNIKEANISLTEKNNSCGKDGMMLSDVYEYFVLNRDKIIASIKDKKYKCKTTLLQEMLNYKGKKRIIAKMCSVDRLIARAMEQVLSKALNSSFSNYSFAYRKNYGVHKAVEVIFDYVKKYRYVCSVDIKNYFDEVNHDIMINEAKKVIRDNDVIYLIECFLKCEIEYDYVNSIKNKGLIQGNSLSPLLSNLYLNSLDFHLEKRMFHL